MLTPCIALRHWNWRMQRKILTEVTEFIFLGFSRFHEQQITFFMVFLILYITLGWLCRHCEHHPHWSSPPHSHALLPMNAGQFKDHVHTGHHSTNALWPRSPEPANLPGRMYHSNILLSYLSHQQLLSAHGEGVWPLCGHLQPFEIHTHHEQEGVHPADEWRRQHWLGHGSCPISVFTLPFCHRVVGHFFCGTLPVIKFSCIDTTIDETIDFVVVSVSVILVTMGLVFTSYILIISTIL